MTKRIVTILALSLCFLLTASCGTEAVLERLGVPAEASLTDLPPMRTAAPSASPLVSPSPAPATGTGTETDARTPQAAGSPPVSGNGQAGADFPDFTPEQYVQDAWQEPGVLPRLMLDTPEAEAVNQRIAEDFFPAANDPMCQLHYECGKGAGRVLSILMVMQSDNDWVEYTPYNIDMTTGQLLTGKELLTLLEVDEEELTDLEQAALGESFTGLYGAARDTTDGVFYDQQFARTTSADNAELERLWFDDAGTLCFAGRVYSLAGAEYYERPLSTGLVF